MKILLVGCGVWGRAILRDLCQMSLDVWVFDPSSQARQGALAEGAERVFCDPLAAESTAFSALDGIILATPTSGHAQDLERWWALGIPLFVEKPLFANLCDFDVLKHAPAGICIHVMHIWRYHPALIAMRDAIADGALGEVQVVRTERLGWTSPRQDVGSIPNLLIHDLSIADLLIGQLPVVSSAHLERDAMGVERWGQIVLQQPELPLVSMEFGNRSPWKSRLIRIQGTEGAFVFDESRDPAVHWFKGDAQTPMSRTTTCQLAFDGSTTALQNELRAWLNFLAGGHEPETTPEQALRYARVLATIAAH